MAMYDAMTALPDGIRPPQASALFGMRQGGAVAINHLTGISLVLLGPVWAGVVGVLAPASRLTDASLVADMVQYGRVKALIAPPLFLRTVSREPTSVAALKQLLYVAYNGAPLDEATGDLLSQHVLLRPAVGSTECGPYLMAPTRDKADWAYYGFWKGHSIQMQPVASDDPDSSEPRHELVFRRDAAAMWQVPAPGRIPHRRPLRAAPHEAGPLAVPGPR